MKLLEEWYADAPWGKIALISWGNPKGYPVLLVHGREDSAATFIPLLQLLSPNYYYVGVDLPGNGKSDPFPPGLVISRFHFMLGVVYAVKHLGWSKFMYMAHSMGTEQGLFFNAIFPNQITKIIHLDPAPAIKRMFTKQFPFLYQGYYENYYENYDMYNSNKRLYSKEQAMNAVKNARGLNDEQAELILSRNLQPVGDGKFRLSWGKTLKIAAPWNFSDDFYCELFSKNAPPTLVISANNYFGVFVEDTEKYHNFIDRLGAKIPNFCHIVADGGHDLHFLTPEVIAEDINKFMDNDFSNKTRAKL